MQMRSLLPLNLELPSKLLLFVIYRKAERLWKIMPMLMLMLLTFKLVDYNEERNIFLGNWRLLYVCVIWEQDQTTTLLRVGVNTFALLRKLLNMDAWPELNMYWHEKNLQCYYLERCKLCNNITRKNILLTSVLYRKCLWVNKYIQTELNFYEN